MTTATKAAPPDVARFKANKSRVTDFYEHNAHVCNKQHTLMVTASIFADMRWLCEEVRRLGGTAAVDDLPRFEKIEKFVGRVCREQAGSVTSGQFVKVRGDIFAAWRFLVRALETTFKYVLEVEDQLELGPRLKEEHAGAITLDLEEGLGDPDGPAADGPAADDVE